MRFDDIEIDTERFEMRRAGQAISVEPKVLDLIRYMADNANKLLSKDDLIEHVWQGRIVSDAALSTAVKSARRAMGDDDPATSRIKTVRGRGFRMELEDVAPSSAAVEEKPAHIFVQPSFAVLTPEGAGPWGADVQRRLSAAMGRVPFVTVAAPMLLRGLDARDPAALAQALGRGFALDLSVFGEGAETRMDCILFDTGSGAAIWNHETDAFDPATDIRKVAGDLIVRLEPQLVRAVYTALASKPDPADPRALTMQALGMMSLKGWNRGAFVEAEALLRRALAGEPNLPFACAALALITALGQEVGLAEPAPHRREEAIDLAEKALSLDGLSPLILGFTGCAMCDAGQPLRGKTLLRRALDLDSGNPQAKAALGTQLIREGEFEVGSKMLTEAIASSARDTKLSVWRSVLSMALLRLGRMDEALAEAEAAVAADDNTHVARVVLAVVQHFLGRKDASKEAWRDAKRVLPSLQPDDARGIVGHRGVEALNALEAG